MALMIVLHRVDNDDEAETFLSSDELRAPMGRAGVQPGTMRAELFEEA